MRMRIRGRMGCSDAEKDEDDIHDRVIAMVDTDPQC